MSPLLSLCYRLFRARNASSLRDASPGFKPRQRAGALPPSGGERVLYRARRDSWRGCLLSLDQEKGGAQRGAAH